MKKIILKSEDFGNKWPFKCDTVVVQTRGPYGLTVRPVEIITNPMVFALNGIAQNAGIPPLDDQLWKDNPETGAKMSIMFILKVVSRSDIIKNPSA